MTPWREDFVNLLRDYYKKQKSKNTRYSIRALARDLGVAHGPLAGILKGTQSWKFSANWAAAILEQMKITGEARNRMLSRMGLRPVLKSRSIIKAESLLMMHWAYWPVLCFFELVEKPSILLMARKLQIPETEVQAIVKDLVSRKFLKKTGPGQYRVDTENVVLEDDLPHVAFRDIHRDHLKIAEKALNAIPAGEREFQTLTVSGSLSSVEEVKQEIRAFVERIGHLLSREQENNEVFRLSVQLFPFDFSKSQKQ
ncbi:hypothetical protein AZI86_17060 [Bdellovibrio bacteriovorus]|uniref:DUF4423 domain-containing protein n=1 Tax=Bdellovibrio bacteriovorus TaxID=959 RepID=A0A150WER0_BDEBC|nr:TIGR02147 family protein [Bdellovibrio bacteriovorus]KYG61423.1 hypothetical protein AZI86_17060 [Bdellovibrio bacteriovorus]